MQATTLPPRILTSSGAAQVKRRESTRIILHGQSEFEASDVVLIGNHMFEVTARLPPALFRGKARVKAKALRPTHASRCANVAVHVHPPTRFTASSKASRF